MMIYLERFCLPDEDQEYRFRLNLKQTSYTTIYPFYTLTDAALANLEFEPITILYGGNGSGKTTVLNVIAEALQLKRTAPYNRSSFFEDFVAMCTSDIRQPVPDESKIVTSDDVFDYMLNVRSLNEGIDRRREVVFEDHVHARYSNVRVNSLSDYEALKRQNSARRLTQSAFVRSELMPNVRELSNGESALYYFKQQIDQDALYLLDEPENSLSAQKQIELAQFLEESARFMNCQLIISTHSPFLLAMKHVKIYDLDSKPAVPRRWTELGNVRAYHDFFEQHRADFSRTDQP